MAYKVTGSKLLAIRDALKDAFNLATLVELMLGLDRKLEDYADPGSAYPLQILALVRGADDERWLVDLLDRAAVLRPDDPELGRLRAELGVDALPAGFDPFDMCCLSGEYVLVNRRELRCALKAMRTANGKRILIVRDKALEKDALLGTKTGKSQTVQYISALNQRLGGFEHIWVDLRTFNDQLGVDAGIQPRDLALKLVRLLGYDPALVPSAPTDSQWSRWAIDFCDSFDVQGRKDARQVWIVIDEFNTVKLPQGTADLIKQLADRIRVTLHQFRLILIGYRDSFEPSLLPLVTEDKTERLLSNLDLVEFFLRAGQQLNRSVSEERSVEAALKTLTGLDPAAGNYLEEVGRRAYAQLAEFE